MVEMGIRIKNAATIYTYDQEKYIYLLFALDFRFGDGSCLLELSSDRPFQVS